MHYRSMTGRARRQSQPWSPRQHPPSSRRQFPHNLARSFAATLSNTESKTLVFRGLQNMPQDMLRGVTYDMRGSASQNPTRALGARPGEVRTFAVKALVTDEVLHPFGKVQPLLIGLILPGPTTSGRSHCADCRLPRTRTCGAPRPPRSFLVTPPPSDPHVRGAPHHQQIVHTCTIMDT